MWYALTRAPGPALARCELTHLPREAIDLARAAAQHREYEARLDGLGCRVQRLPETPERPDAVFVEDTAVVLDELAVITRPGAVSRRPETSSVAEALSAYRPLVHIAAPGVLDGGDVLRVGRCLYVGLQDAGRSNAAGVEQLTELVRSHGYTVQGVPVRGCLHLKSAVTEAGEGVLLLNPDWVDASAFAGARVILVDPSEPAAANVLRVDEGLLAAAAYPRTVRRLRSAGLAPEVVDASELAKAEGALTCCSLIFQA